MFALVITIHVIACALLILIVLIQQGKGGGLIDTFSSAESIFGTRTNTFLVKSTSVLSVIFFFTCLSLAFLSMQKSKSLIETYKPKQQPSSQSSTSSVPAQASQAAKATSQQATSPNVATKVTPTPQAERLKVPVAQTERKASENITPPVEEIK